MVKIVNYRCAAIALRMLVSSLEEKDHVQRDAQLVQPVPYHNRDFLQENAPSSTKGRPVISAATASMAQSLFAGAASAWHGSRNNSQSIGIRINDSSEMKETRQLDMMLHNLLRIDDFKKLPRSFQDVILHQSFQDVILHQISLKAASTSKGKNASSNEAGLKQTEEFVSFLGTLLKYGPKKMSSMNLTPTAVHQQWHADQAADRGADRGSFEFQVSPISSQIRTLKRDTTDRSDSIASIAYEKHRQNLLQILRDAEAQLAVLLSQNRASNFAAAMCSQGRRSEIISDLHRLASRDSKGRTNGRQEPQRQISRQASNDVLGYSTGPIRFQQSMPTGPPNSQVLASAWRYSEADI